MSVIVLTPSNYNSVMNKPYLVVCFSAKWCGPCKQMRPLLDKLATDHSTLTFVYVDIDLFKNSPLIANITSVPTYNLIINGTIVKTVNGANSKALFDLVKVGESTVNMILKNNM